MKNIEEIRNSGILELYVLGLTDESDRIFVEQSILKHKELVDDIRSIEGKLLSYGKTVEINPSPSTKTKLFKTLHESGRLKGTSPSSTTSTKAKNTSGSALAWTLTAFAALIIGALLGYLLLKQNTDKIIEQQATEIAACDSLSNEQNQQLELFRQLNDSNNTIKQMDATPQYAETKLYFHHNKQTQKNYIQVQNLPEITADQSFQLWSLKGNDPPIPMDVFAGNSDLIEVAFVDGTETYAITIEPKGGSQSPTLENLISTVGIDS